MSNTLFGGRLVKVTLMDESEAEFKVRQLPLGDYEKAFDLIDDEIALVALICGHPKSWADNLTPESYETLHAVAQEVNAKGFFAWSKRRQQRVAEQQKDILPLMMNLSPEQIKSAVATGMQLVSKPSSPKRNA
jgi:hypothetical protein